MASRWAVRGAIAQDDDGYLWLGTDAGLFRFDGVRFLPWTTPDAEPPLRRLGPIALVRSRWQPVDRFRRGRPRGSRSGRTPRIYGEAEGLPGVAVTALVEDSDHPRSGQRRRADSSPFTTSDSTGQAWISACRTRRFTASVSIARAARRRHRHGDLRRVESSARFELLSSPPRRACRVRSPTMAATRCTSRTRS